MPLLWCIHMNLSKNVENSSFSSSGPSRPVKCSTMPQNAVFAARKSSLHITGTVHSLGREYFQIRGLDMVSLFRGRDHRTYPYWTSFSKVTLKIKYKGVLFLPGLNSSKDYRQQSELSSRKFSTTLGWIIISIACWCSRIQRSYKTPVRFN